MLNVTAPHSVWEDMATAKDGSRPKWTEQKKRFLGKNVTVMTDVEVAEKLGKTRSGVRHMCQRLGLGQAKHSPSWRGMGPSNRTNSSWRTGMGAQELAKELAAPPPPQTTGGASSS